ncbi:MAG: hypothetical protein HRT38_19850 [Alteromonadaceae bacterium]|nr:hypothetical protein [Alteromonadaceae bacterium]
MKKNNKFVNSVLVLLMCIFNQVHATEFNEKRSETTKSVSIFKIIGTPNMFHEREIIVTGVYRFDLDLATLYPSEEHLIEDKFKSSISLELPIDITSEQLEVLMDLDGKFVRVSGTFDAINRGYSGFNKGTITNVKAISKHIN